MTLTIAGPAFPILIIALVPIRLFLMNRLWDRETLRYVDSWACREGTPEGDEDARRVERSCNTSQIEVINDEERGLAPGALRSYNSDTRHRVWHK